MTDHADTIRCVDGKWRTANDFEVLLAERQQAIDALREIVAEPDAGIALYQAKGIARAALVSLGEQP